MARLDLIKFDTGAFGLQEVDDNDNILALYDENADQLPFQKRSWTFVRTLAGAGYDHTDPDDFWHAIEGVDEITPREP